MTSFPRCNRRSATDYARSGAKRPPATLFGTVPERRFGRVVERQTRWLQVPVRESVWGFKSPLAHEVYGHETVSQRVASEIYVGVRSD